MDLEDFAIQAQPTPHRRRISLTLLLSLTVHGWLMLVLTASLVRDATPSDTSTPHAIEIALISPDSADESGRGGPPVPLPEALVRPLPATEGPAATLQPLVEPAHAAPEAGAPEVKRPSIADVADAADVAGSEGDEPSVASVEKPVLTLARASDHAVAAPAESQPARRAAVERPVLPDQNRVLDRKLRRWAQDLREFEGDDDALTWRHGGQEYSASVEHLPARNDTEFDRAVVRINTEIDGVTHATEVRLKRLAFSHFAQLIDRWDRNVSFSDDVIEGRFHSNSKIVVTPDREVETRFEGRVTVASTVQFNRFGRRTAIFPAGLETKVRRIRLPREDLAASAEDPTNSVRRFQRDTALTFSGDGTVACRETEEPGRAYGFELSGEANHLVAEDGVTLSVEGVVRGAVIVYSPRGIRITGDLRYARDPERQPDSPDFIGLISARSVEVAEPELTGPGDLTIQAAIYARRRFAVRDYRHRNEGLMTVYGSVTAGSLTATEPRFATRLVFDQRLEAMRPPGFPMTDRYEVESWDRTWREIPEG